MLYCCVVCVCTVGEHVLAEWRDERYYPATVVSIANQGSIDVMFTDSSTMTVQRGNVVRCGRIPVGCTVLARVDGTTAWYELAVIQSHYTDDQSALHGYVVQFASQTSHTRCSFIVFVVTVNSLSIHLC